MRIQTQERVVYDAALQYFIKQFIRKGTNTYFDLPQRSIKVKIFLRKSPQ